VPRTDTSRQVPAPLFNLSLTEAADRLGCSPRTLRRMVASGELEARRVGKRLLRVCAEDVDALARPIPTA
jgi:excisionase family DNA binding protein